MVHVKRAVFYNNLINFYARSLCKNENISSNYHVVAWFVSKQQRGLAVF